VTKPAEKKNKDKDKSKSKDEKSAVKKAAEAQAQPQGSQEGEGPGKERAAKKEGPSGSAKGEAPAKEKGKTKKKSSSSKKAKAPAKAKKKDSPPKVEEKGEPPALEASKGPEPAKSKKTKKTKKTKKKGKASKKPEEPKAPEKAPPAEDRAEEKKSGAGSGQDAGNQGKPPAGEEITAGEKAEATKPAEPENFAEGFSRRTMEVLEAARALKDRLGHGAVTTGHLVAAILEEEAGISRDVFWDINAYPDMFVEEMARIKEIPPPESEYWFDDLVGLVIERARDGAEALGGGPVEPEHLALALLSLAEGPAAEILEEFSMDREDLKAEILAHMGVPVEECPDWEHETKREKSRRIRKQKARK